MIKTKRLILRTWKRVDLPGFTEMNSDPSVMQFFPNTLTSTESLILMDRFKDHFTQWNYGFYAVEYKENSEFIGFIGLSHPAFDSDFTPCVEIGWRLSRKYWGKGLATEGAFSVLKYAFDTLNLKEVYSFTTFNNHLSERVMQKIGMQKIGSFMHPNLDIDHPLCPHVLYKASRQKWLLSNQ